MKVGLQTWGSDGDIHPFIALAAGLAQNGHQVTLAVMSAERKDYEHFGKRLGFKVVSMGYIGTEGEDLQQIGRRLFTSSADPLKQLKIIFEEMFKPGIEVMSAMARSLCAENDLLIGHFIVYPLQTIAEKYAKPYITVTLNQAGIPTRYAPPPPLPSIHPWFNLFIWNLLEKILNRNILPFINLFRCQEGMPPVTSFRKVWESSLCNLIAVSSHFCPPRPDWEDYQKVCGFFCLPEQAQPWQISEQLIHFLAEGPPPIYMTLGSMLSVDIGIEYLTSTTQLLIDAAKLVGCRAIIQSSWQQLSNLPAYPNIYRMMQRVPHPQIFPYCAAVVHHGGAGTTQTATLCGCPSVVVAHVSDQFFWGTQLKRLGVAPRLLYRHTVTAKNLAREIQRVIETPKMSENAKTLGRSLRKEDGVKVAVEQINTVLHKLTIYH